MDLSVIGSSAIWLMHLCMLVHVMHHFLHVGDHKHMHEGTIWEMPFARAGVCLGVWMMLAAAQELIAVPLGMWGSFLVALVLLRATLPMLGALLGRFFRWEGMATEQPA